METAADPQGVLIKRDAEIAHINSYVDIKDEVKERRIAEVKAKAQVEYEEAKQAEKLALQKEVITTRNAVYNVPTQGAISQGEKEQVREVYRNLWDVIQIRTADLGEAKEELGQILDQAERTGDGMLARVAYHRALDIGAQQTELGALTDFGMQEIVDRYLEGRDKEARALERYNKALEAANQANSVESLLAQAFTDQMFAS